MNADYAFFTGKTHHICQDYARTGIDGTYAILSDGCSGSKDTDTGARLLTLAAERSFKINKTFDTKLIAGMARASADSCGLQPECLDATLLTIHIEDNETESDQWKGYKMLPSVFAVIRGDGVAVVKRKDGTLRIHWKEYISGYPYYVNYELNQKRLNEWEKTLNVSGNRQDAVVHHTVIINNNIVEKRYRSDYKSPVSSSIIGWDNIEIKADPNIPPQALDWSSGQVISLVEDTSWVAILSDGVLSFTEKAIEAGQSNRPIPVEEVVKDLLDFKNFNGQFVQRQANWFIKQAAKKNWQHDDDLSVAVLYLG